MIPIPRPSLVVVLLAPVFILLLPLLAMQLGDEVKWTPSDFTVAWVLLTVSGLTYHLVTRRVGDARYCAAVGLSLFALLLLAWANLAVGLIGDERNPANLLYGEVPAVGLLGLVLFRGQPRALARVLVAMAVTQALVPLAALAFCSPLVEATGVELLGVNGFFVVLFSGAAWLFQRAARRSAGGRFLFR